MAHPFAAISARVQTLRGRFLAVNFGAQALDLACVEFQAGRIKILAAETRSLDADASAEALAGAILPFRKAHGISQPEVLLSLNDSESVMVKQLFLPVLGDVEMANAARWQLKNDAPFPVDDALLDWQVVGESTGSDGTPKRQVTFVAARKTTVDVYLAAVRQCQLLPLVLSSGVINYGHILREAEAPEVAAVLDIKNRESFLAIYVQHKLHFFRRMPISADKFTQALTEPLVTERGKVQLSLAEAEQVKERYGIPLDVTLESGEGIHPGQMLALMRPLLEALGRELRFSISYFRSNAGADRPFALYITGEGANLKNLPDYIGKELELAVEPLPVPPRVEIQASGDGLKIQNRIMDVVGATVSGVQTLNLLPPEARVKQSELITNAVLRLGLTALAGILAVALFMNHLRIQDYQSRVKTAGVHLQTVATVNQIRSRITGLEGLAEKLYHNRVPMDGLLKVVSQVLPAQVVLEEMTFGQAKGEMIFKGSVMADERSAETILTGLMQDMENSPYFGEVSLRSSQRMGIVQRFEISGQVAQEP